MIKIDDQNLINAWMVFYIPPFFLAFEIIYHIATDTPFWLSPIPAAIPIAVFAFFQLVPILTGQALIFYYVSTLKVRICLSVLLCFIITCGYMYWLGNNKDPEIVVKGEKNAALLSSIITMPITISFLCFANARNELKQNKLKLSQKQSHPTSTK